ncbi:MAG: hypothetical protein AAF654_04080 [Myxococcota bacterium]
MWLIFAFGAIATSGSPTAMDNARIDSVLKKVSEKVERRGNVWRVEVETYSLMVITDERADRMRVMSLIGPAEKLDRVLLERMMQANFDSALDARYAIANEKLWSVFIRPLSSLTDRDLISGVAQTINCVATFGASFSSGALVFGGGDSPRLEAERLQRLLKKGEVEL